MKTVELIPAAKALEMMTALVAICESIATTNNGKLMIMRIENRAHRKMVPDLVASGALTYATFMNTSDSVRIAA